MEERHVELERVEAVVLEHVERGIAAAEVVEPDFAARLLEVAQSLAYGIIRSTSAFSVTSRQRRWRAS